MFYTALQMAEKALEKIGAFSPFDNAPDEEELNRALSWLDLVLNCQIGMMPVAGYWKTIDIPLEAGIGDYLLDDYSGEHQTQDVFSVNIYTFADPKPRPVEIVTEPKAVDEDLTKTGTPKRATIEKGTRTVLRLFPTPNQNSENLGEKVRVRIQVYQNKIDKDGTGDTEIQLRPSWYLWGIAKLAYTIGTGPVRKLNENELERIKDDIISMEGILMANDGAYKTSDNKVQPIEGSYW